jgi:hypothetical protein
VRVARESLLELFSERHDEGSDRIWLSTIDALLGVVARRIRRIVV